MPGLFSKRSKPKAAIFLSKDHHGPVSSKDIDRLALVSASSSSFDARPLPSLPNAQDLLPHIASSHAAASQDRLVHSSNVDDALLSLHHIQTSEFGQNLLNDSWKSANTAPALLEHLKNGSIGPTLSISRHQLSRNPSRGSLPSTDSNRSQMSRSASTRGLRNPKHAEKAKLSYDYGYTIQGCDAQLDATKVYEILQTCSEQIRNRGLDSPLIFSSMTLDLSPSSVSSLIKSYLGSFSASININKRRGVPPAFVEEVRYANPHDLAAVVKWAFARMGRVLAVPVPASVNMKKGQILEEMVYVQQRGFLDLDLYNAWRDSEKRQRYPPTAFQTFLQQLEPDAAELLSSLFALLSSTTSYSLKNGMIPSKLSKHFGVLLFGLPEDETFARTYDTFVRASNATEHLFLAYIRNQAASSSLPPRLTDQIARYPAMLSSELAVPSKSSKLVPITQIERTVRLYSPDLIQTACETDLPIECPEWQACRHENETLGKDPQLSDRFRKLVNLRGGSAQGRIKGSANDRLDHVNVEAHGSLVSKQWSDFLFDGFAAPDESKLAFDLNESARKNRVPKRDNVQWSDFQKSGFNGDDDLDVALEFNQRLKHELEKWPDERDQIVNRLRERQKTLPPFRYDTTPRLVCSPTTSGSPTGKMDRHPISRIDEAFAEVWADYLIGSGWSNRDELTHRPANFVIVQYKSRPTCSTVGSQNDDSNFASPTQSVVPPSQELPQDPRVDAAWFVVQEIVPQQYRYELEAIGRGKGKDRAMIRKLTLFRSRKEKSQEDHNSFTEDDVFRPGPGGQTKHIRLSDALVTLEKPRPAEGNPDSHSLHHRDANKPLGSDEITSAASYKPRRSQDSGHGFFKSEASGKFMSTLRSKSLRIAKLRKGPTLPQISQDTEELLPPIVPPKSTSSNGFNKRDQSFTSEDFETRSLKESEGGHHSPPDNDQRKPKRQSRDDSWIDIMLKANQKRMLSQDAIWSATTNDSSITRNSITQLASSHNHHQVTDTLTADTTTGHSTPRNVSGQQLDDLSGLNTTIASFEPTTSSTLPRIPSKNSLRTDGQLDDDDVHHQTRDLTIAHSDQPEPMSENVDVVANTASSGVVGETTKSQHLSVVTDSDQHPVTLLLSSTQDKNTSNVINSPFRRTPRTLSERMEEAGIPASARLTRTRPVSKELEGDNNKPKKTTTTLDTKKLIESLRMGLSAVEAVRRSKEVIVESEPFEQSFENDTTTKAKLVQNDNSVSNTMVVGVVVPDTEMNEKVSSVIHPSNYSSSPTTTTSGYTFEQLHSHRQWRLLRRSSSSLEQQHDDDDDDQSLEPISSHPPVPFQQQQQQQQEEEGETTDIHQFIQPYQPGMPLDNVIEESESVVSGV